MFLKCQGANLGLKQTHFNHSNFMSTAFLTIRVSNNDYRSLISMQRHQLIFVKLFLLR